VLRQQWWLFGHCAIYALLGFVGMPLFLMLVHNRLPSPIGYGLSIGGTLFMIVVLFAWAIIGSVMTNQQTCDTPVMVAYVVLDFLLSIIFPVIIPLMLCAAHDCCKDACK